MYLEHFTLKAAPFAITPDPRFFYEGAKYKKLLTVLQDRLAQGSLCALTGNKGVGKSTVIMQLCRRLGRKYKIVRITRPDMTAENLLNYLVFELNLADGLLERAAAELHVQEWLAEDGAGNRLLVIVENADKMPLSSRQVLADLKSKPLGEGNVFSALLSGPPALQDSLDSTDGWRLATTYMLSPLSNREVREYLNFRTTHVGDLSGHSLFDKAVSLRIAQLSDGIPRNIHLLADKVLCAAYNLNAPVPTADMLSETPRLEETVIDNVAAEQHGYEWLLALGCVLIALMIYVIEPGEDAVLEAALPTESQPRYIVKSVVESRPAPSELVDEGLALEASTAQHLDVLYADELVTALAATEVEAPQGQITESIELMPELVPEDREADLSPLARSQQRLLSWLEGVPESAGTIQLLLVRGGQDTRINEYLRQLSTSLDASQIMTYATVKQGRAYYGVLYQQYSSRKLASANLKNLPEEIKKLGPFIVRSAKGVQDEQS